VGVIARKQKSEPQRLEAAECKGVLLARVKLVPFPIKIPGLKPDSVAAGDAALERRSSTVAQAAIRLPTRLSRVLRVLPQRLKPGVKTASNAALEALLHPNRDRQWNSFRSRLRTRG
jgi:hypothetical protein